MKGPFKFNLASQMRFKNNGKIKRSKAEQKEK
jgi:hypothetical protein